MSLTYSLPKRLVRLVLYVAKCLNHAKAYRSYSSTNGLQFCALFQNDNDEFTVTHDAELECKINIVVYDGTTESLDDLGESFCISWFYCMSVEGICKTFLYR